MARRVFFSFHYERDIWRVNQVRNCWMTQERQVAGYWDASLWEESKLQGKAAIEKLIDGGLSNTSVTVVLIGAETNSREYVDYEIKQSYARNNGMLGVYIHGLKNQGGAVDTKGANPFDRWHVTKPDGTNEYFSQKFETYDWAADNGYGNFASWVEAAAKAAGR